MTKKSRHNTASLVFDLKPLVKKLVKIRKLAETNGLFTNDRELLECSCGLIEDVAFDGRLFTYRTSDPAFSGTGLQFRKVNKDVFCCPICKAMLKVKYL
jgi:hypothetical protein